MWWSDVTWGEHTDYSQCLSGRSLQDKIDVSVEIRNLYDKVCSSFASFTDIFKDPNQPWLSNSKFRLNFVYVIERQGRLNLLNVNHVTRRISPKTIDFLKNVFCEV